MGGGGGRTTTNVHYIILLYIGMYFLDIAYLCIPYEMAQHTSDIIHVDLLKR